MNPAPPTSHVSAFIASLPNRLSAVRIAAVPVLLLLYPLDFNGLQALCALLFGFAAFTDFADGFIARRYGVESRLGALIDPIADKMLTTAALVVLASTGDLWPSLAGLLLCREVAMTGLRLIALEEGITIPVSIWGKIKTLVMDISIFCLMLNVQFFGWPFREVGMAGIWVTFLLSYGSAGLYLQAFLRHTKALPPPRT